MKSTILFVLIIILGAIGGIAAGEVKKVFFEPEVVTAPQTDTAALADLVDKQNEISDEIEDLIEENERKEAQIIDLQEKLKAKEKENNTAENNVVSKNEEINNLQAQINDLRGIVKAYQQSMDDLVKAQVQKIDEQKQAAEEERRAEQRKQWAEQMKQRQEEAYTSHVDKMKTELGISDSQAISIREALNQRGEKLQEMFTNGNYGFNNRDEARQKMEEIQKEWEESAKSVLSPKQYEDFMSKNLNDLNGGFGGGRRPGRSSNNNNRNTQPR